MSEKNIYERLEEQYNFIIELNQRLNAVRMWAYQFRKRTSDIAYKDSQEWLKELYEILGLKW